MISPAANTLRDPIRRRAAPGPARDRDAHVGEGDPRAQREAVERRRVDRLRPVALGRLEPAVWHSSSRAGSNAAAGAIARCTHVDRSATAPGSSPSAPRAPAIGRRRTGRYIGGMNLSAHLGVHDRVGDLAGLPGDVPAPDRVPLRPELLALVVEPLAVAVDHDPERDESSRVAMPPSNRGDRASTATAWKPRSSPRVAAPARTARRSTVPSLYAGPRMMSCRRRRPSTVEPLDVGLEAAAGADHGAGRDRAAAPPRRSPSVHRSPAEFQVLDGAVVPDGHAAPRARRGGRC